MHCVGTECSGLYRHKAGAITLVAVVACETALHELPRKHWTVCDRHHIADQHLPEARGQRRREVTHLISVREDHVCGFFFLDELMQSGGEGIGRIALEQ